MSGICYDLGKIRGIALDVDGVLSPSTIPMDENGKPIRMVNIKDGYALQLAMKLDFNLAIITGGTDPSVERRYRNLGIRDIYMGASHKIDIFNEWLERRGLSPEETAYMGDDIPDIPCMRHAGLACAPADAAHEVRETATYISRYNGGHGCVRDLIEQVLRARGDWMREDTAFGW